MSWWDGRMVGFDLETTAADPEEARIVQAAIANCGGGLATEAFVQLADPGVPIPDEAAAIHGITTERARAEGQPLREVVQAVVGTLAVHARGGTPIVVFNAPYDFTVLDRECRRLDLEPLDLDGVRVVDPLVIDKFLDRYRRGSRKLAAICEQRGATLDAAHDATFDAVAACRTAWVLGSKGFVNRKYEDERRALADEWEAVRGDLDELHARQAVWYREQTMSLAAYFAEKGQHEDAARVRMDWPVIPFESWAKVRELIARNPTPEEQGTLQQQMQETFRL